MSSYDKVVKLACKPKPAPPKAKYLDPIIAATWSEDGAVHDVCKALSPRFREPNAVVVFKALIVLHTMIRNGATDNVLSYLSSSEVLRLGNVSAGNWDGYAAPQNLQNYALYLDSRIRAYRDLKHDAIRVQAESNRDMRNSANLEEDNAYRGRGSITNKENTQGPTRSKTIMGRKLRVMTVEKGLLRETRAVHRMIDTLVECRFYLDDLEDELTTTALRMLVKDLLILFQAGNEGVINVLEHYFEMSHVDAEQALAIYRHFCQQTEKVVEYLGVAKKLQNLLNVPIPNLKHAPVSLAGALEEYLSDPNFEQNRIEYKTNKEASERAIRNGTKKIAKKDSSPAPPLPTSTSTSAASTSSATALTTSTTDANKQKEAIDFFATIEEEQSNMFNPQTNSPNVAYFQQNQASNPFTLRQMATGQPFGGMQPQATGFVMPQQTGFPGAPNPFGMQPQQQQLQLPQQASHLRPQPTAGGHRPFSSFLPQNNGLQPQQTGFLQPQATGANPFRQSMMMPQTTGMAMFGGMQGGQQQLSPSPFQNMAGNAFGSTPNTFSSFGQGQGQGMPAMGNVGQSQPQGPTAFSPSPSIGSGMTPFSQQTQAQNLNMPARPASTPLTSFGASSSSTGPSPPVAQPVKTHQTGTKNPFGPIATPPPPVPKQPTLMELAMGFGGNVGGQQQPAPPPQQQQQPAVTGANGFNFGSSALNPGRTDMSSVASSFSFSKSEPNGTTSPSSTTPASSAFSLLNSQNTSTTTTGSVSDSLFTSSTLSTQPTGASSPSISVSSPLKSQMTGFSGLKPFKPSSSFGASLMESLPPIPGSAPTSPAITGANPPSSTGLQPTGIVSTFSGSGSSGLGVLNAQPTSNFSSGSTLGQGLRPQMTGSNPAANPFRASMFSTGSGNTLGGGLDAGSAFPSSASFGSGTSSNLFGGSSGLSGLNGGSASSAGGSMFGGSAFGSFNHQQQQQQQYQQNTSLI